MKASIPVLGAGLFGAVLVLSIGASLPPQSPAGTGGGGRFEVTVTNLTSGQLFAPVLVATHDDGVALFTEGQAASSELGLLAEEGDTSALAALLASMPGVGDVSTGTGMIAPGASESISVRAPNGARLVSLAGMLVSTNDTFVGLNGFSLPNGKSADTHAAAYDAGTERNSESCVYVPGPPCGAAGAHDPAPAEGFVHVSNGIHGIADLAADAHDWRNPVARISIRRLP